MEVYYYQRIKIEFEEELIPIFKYDFVNLEVRLDENKI